MSDTLLIEIRQLVKAGRTADAARLAREGVNRDPKSVPLLEQLATVELALGNYDLAVEAARQAFSLDPGSMTALEVLAEGYSLAGDDDQAMIAAETAVERAPRKATPYYLRAMARNNRVTPVAAWVLNKATRAEFRQALADLDRAIELDPWNPKFHTLKGEIWSRRGNTGDARAAYAAAIQLDPTNARALAAISELDIETLRLGEAGKEVEAAFALNPQSPELRKRSRQFLRMRVMLPLWVATLTPAAAFFAWLLIGHPSPIIAGVVIIGTILSIGFAVLWWQRRLTPNDRHRLLGGDARRITVIASIMWVLLTLSGLVFLRSQPTVELWQSSQAEPPPPPSMGDLLGILAVSFAGAGVAVGAVIWLQSKVLRSASRLGDRIGKISDSRADPS